MKRGVWAVAAAAVLAASLASCGKARTPENFCSAFYAEGQNYQNAMKADRSHGAMGAVGSLLAAPSYLADLFDKLDEVAPDDIEPDVARVRDAYRKVAGQLGDGGSTDPRSTFGRVAGGIMIGLSVRGSEQRVFTYISQHCTPPKR